MIQGLSEADRVSWRTRRQLPERSSDLSPNGRYEVGASGDAIALQDRQDGFCELRPLPPERGLERTTIADDGRTAAFSARDPRGETHLYVSTPEQPAREIASAWALYGIDFSPNGNTLAYVSLDQVKIHEGETTRTLAKLPNQLDEVHYLPDGRLLVQGRSTHWTNGSVPTFWLLDSSGQYAFVNDPRAAEALEPGVLKSLDEGYSNAFPMADAEQRGVLIEQFGYHTPTFRQPSPDKDRMVFSVRPRLEPTDSRGGIYLARGGQGAAQRLPLTAGSELTDVEWRPDSREAAVVLTRPNGDAQLLIVGDRAEEASLLPHRLEKRETPWSGSGRYAAAQVRVDDLTTIFAFDTEKRTFLPVVTGYQLEGWKGDLLVVSRDGQTLELEPTLLDPRHAPGQLFGSPLPEDGLDPGVRIEPEHVVVGGVRVPRKS